MADHRGNPLAHRQYFDKMNQSSETAIRFRFVLENSQMESDGSTTSLTLLGRLRNAPMGQIA